MVVALVVAVVPVAWLLLHYVPARIRRAREAGAATRLRGRPGELPLLAFRAVAHQPLERLEVVEDPVSRFQRSQYAELAALETETLGLAAGAAAAT